MPLGKIVMIHNVSYYIAMDDLQWIDVRISMSAEKSCLTADTKSLITSESAAYGI